MTINVGINGMGRIGRMVIRAIIESQNKNIKIKHINNRSNSEASCTLIKYDSVHGKFNADLDFDERHLIINKNKITFSQESKVEDINWKKFNVDYVFECTGKFNSKEKLLAHIKNGAKKVIVSAPCKNADKTIVYGVNEDTLSSKDLIVSNGSCTTNCLAPIAKVLNDLAGIKSGYMTTIHAYTGDQALHDGDHKDLYRARAASLSMIPTSTGAARAISLVLPELTGKLEGSAIRVPTPNVSLVDLSYIPNRSVSVDEIDAALKSASEGRMNGILNFENEPKVSIDYNHTTTSSNYAQPQTTVTKGGLVRVVSWYDNEWGFSNRMIDTAKVMANL